MNIILLVNRKRITRISKHINKYKFKMNLEKLGVSKYFQFNKTFKELIQ